MTLSLNTYRKLKIRFKCHDNDGVGLVSMNQYLLQTYSSITPQSINEFAKSDRIYTLYSQICCVNLLCLYIIIIIIVINIIERQKIIFRASNLDMNIIQYIIIIIIQLIPSRTLKHFETQLAYIYIYKNISPNNVRTYIHITLYHHICAI